MAKNEDAGKWQIWHNTGMSCPEGTIPIRRVVSHKSGAAERVTGGHEARNAGEFSLGQIWLVSGSYDTNDLNSIEAGWQVYPHLYFDNQPRFFIFWTSDAYNISWCYNLRCAGFIQTSRTIVIEGAISPTSISGGTQTDLTIQIWKDPNFGLWWLAVGLNNGTVLSPVGYWPIEIFTRLTEYAEIVQWGGEIVNENSYDRHTTTQMGSGYFPDSGSKKTAYMCDLQIARSKGDFEPLYDLKVRETNPDYYKVKMSSNTSFYYGGSQHAGAFHFRLSSIILYFSFSVFLLF
ncbi:unnamed protein product [Arabidopsis arenosa]|uniref:Neprosin PEP catalytic domain-containing protein n=1 Tax=Arabidopsis arenosa TaxID=38785 RepID=A0A8S2AGS1_ARAAE|nr:unnamed protein product [Arabidopsis arenosa]